MRMLLPILVGILTVACGDGDTSVSSPVEPTPPPTPPLTATMAPSSGAVVVGNSVVFAVNTSGGATGESASWTCASSNPGIATASNTTAGCQATGVAAGDVTITATVTKGGESINVASQLTVTPPRPPPLTATMSPASQTIGVGGTVVFTVSVSGGAAGEAASWTCASSNPGIATASNTTAGCQATGVAAGDVTITATVTKGGESINVASQLTVTPPPPPPPLTATMSPASQTIGVGGTVVFAVSVSGGAAGEAASWTCASSDPSKATVSVVPVGCQATALAAGGVSIVAAVTKGGETVNTGASLFITRGPG